MDYRELCSQCSQLDLQFTKPPCASPAFTSPVFSCESGIKVSVQLTVIECNCWIKAILKYSQFY